MDWGHLKDQYAIVGVGYTPQGKVPDRTALSFHVEACLNAVRDAGLTKEDIDGLLLYRYFEPVGGDRDITAFTVAEQLGIRPTVLSQEHYCTRSWLMHAIGLLECGFCRYVVVSYGDNARSGGRNFVEELSGTGKAFDELAAYGDFSTLAKYAMVARRAMEVYGTGPDVWKEIAIAQRQWAQLNPRAGMYGKPLDDAGYYANEYVAEPFRMLDATPVSDGGRAIVITSAERAKHLPHPPVYITGFGTACQPVSPFRLLAEDEVSAAAVAGKMAFGMAGMTPTDIDACQIYDCFTYTVEATLADYGFYDPRDSAAFLTREHIGPGGGFALNTSGGLLSEAYFMGLTPVSEAVMQLMGRCETRQLGVLPGTKQPRAILCSDNGGVLQSHCAMILTRQ